MFDENLVKLILEELRKEFETVRLSGNLINTIKVYKEDGKWIIDIPAQMYDINRYKKSGVVVYNNRGSYASEVDKSGGFSGKHVDYVDRCIANAIQLWMTQNNIKGKVK